MNNFSLLADNRLTHLKVVMLALACVTLVVGFGLVLSALAQEPTSISTISGAGIWDDYTRLLNRTIVARWRAWFDPRDRRAAGKPQGAPAKAAGGLAARKEAVPSFLAELEAMRRTSGSPPLRRVRSDKVACEPTDCGCAPDLARAKALRICPDSETGEYHAASAVATQM
jgi:hypothetical protein